MGGNIFRGKTQGIKKEYIEPTVAKYLAELGRVFPQKKDMFTKKYFKYIGSVGKKAVSGDIDFAIDISTIVDKRFTDKSIQKWGLNPDEVKKQFEAYKKRAKTATDSEIMLRAVLKGIVTKINAYAENIHCDEKKITSGNIFGFFPQYNEQGDKLDYGVQMDWMVGKLDWLEFSYYSNVYDGNVKGLHRTQLVLSMFQNLGLSFNHTKGVSDKETGETIATNPKEAVEILEERYGIKLSKNTMNDYHKLIKIVNNLPKADRDNIIATYFKILDSTRTDIPMDLQVEWKKRKSELGLSGKFLPDNSMLLESIYRPGFKEYIETLFESKKESDYDKNERLKREGFKKEFSGLAKGTRVEFEMDGDVYQGTISKKAKWSYTANDAETPSEDEPFLMFFSWSDITKIIK